ncbi:ABC transporter ATP-binding protein [Pedobacter sp. MC2016-15]|jgi:ATP-binding cassette subfamily B protein|uniref:ABC transporter ATP-binding protein n=1 Tax=Pedobacter sp. MC2016-15 TaxID=2994473 RepID=UPI00224597A8|nr:ABC transporter ATP-binding protein [Pedobacter sp. MC2016-15]MCX2480200.1 ABC transporter ATP-binding protein [Pedobacter sp. MC2016-15]
MKILLSYLKKHRWTVVLALLMTAINQSFSLVEPLITGKLVDDYINKRDLLSRHEYFSGILTLIGLGIGAAFLSRIANNFQDYFTITVAQKTGAEMYADGMKHSLAMPYHVFEEQRSGEKLDTLQRVRSDSENFIKSSINVTFMALFGIIFVSVYSYFISYKVTIVFVLAVPIITYLSWVLSKKVKVIHRAIILKTSVLAGRSTESLRNIELVKSHGLGEQEIERLNMATYKILNLEVVKTKILRMLSFIQGSTVNIVRSTMIVVMLMLIFDKEISAGQYFSFLLYSYFLFGPLQEFGHMALTWREAQISLANFKRIMAMPIERIPDAPAPLDKIEHIQFKNVFFKYKNSNRNALNGISFHAEEGETVAFVGPSGSGKTTLIKLLVGLYKPFKGDVLYNQTHTDDIHLDQLRRKIGFVTQDTQLFSGNIRDNLRFVKPNATDEECYDALKKAACQSLLSRASDGLDTLIGESGVKVSGGEKQRLSIARALLRNPNILLFDEATSALDSLTEEEITKTVNKLSELKDHITLIIAHRLSTIMHANRIYVLENGHIVESGNHDDLLEQKGLYYAMWRQQVGKRKLVEELNKLDALMES